MPHLALTIEDCTEDSKADWLAMRMALWPDTSEADHRQDQADLLSQPDRYAQFIAYDPDRAPIGFLELCFRHDYVNGTRSSPVAFIEGIYTVPAMRLRGVASRLVAAAERRARDYGGTELASDAPLDNARSREMHKALKFEETERVVYFRKAL
jgi:aminoglycoside 6'-N-acetyltransferase I